MNGSRSLGIGPVGAFMPGEDVMEPAPLVSREMLQAFGPSLLSRMREADAAQQQRWQAGERSPTPMDEESMWLADDLAGGLLGSLPGGVMGAIKAYHGSPHRFDRFDMSKIGTGEGAQAFGHGLYFSEAPGVAGSYRDQLAQWTVDYPTGERIPPGQWGKAEQGIISQALAAGGIDKGAGEIERRLTDLSAKMEKAADFPDRLAGLERLRANLEYDLQFLRGLESSGATVSNPGALYTTRLDVEPEDLLDWDAPLSQQSEKVRAALEPLLRPSKATTQVDDDLLAALMDGPGADELRAAADAMPDWDPTGAEVYRALFGGKTESVFGNSANARQVSQALREAGIPGIRYLDQGSRASGEGTRNFVIFDDKLIDIEGVE